MSDFDVMAKVQAIIDPLEGVENVLICDRDDGFRPDLHDSASIVLCINVLNQASNPAEIITNVATWTKKYAIFLWKFEQGGALLTDVFAWLEKSTMEMKDWEFIVNPDGKDRRDGWYLVLAEKRCE